MQNEFDILRKSRKLTLKALSGLTMKQLNTVPEGFRNSIAWNLAHLVVTQQLLCYRLSGLDCLVSEDWIERFRKGSAPEAEISETEFEAIREAFLNLPDRLEQDFARQLFKTYTTYETSVNVTLDHIEKAIRFNNYHEGIHLGIMLQLKKLV